MREGPCIYLFLFVVLEHGEVEAASAGEAETLVDANGGVIVSEGVQDGGLASVADFVGRGGDKKAGIASAACVGMRADGAHLDVPGR